MLHQGFRALPQCVVLSLGRRILVVPIDVLAAVTGAETLGITGKPGSVGVEHDVKPIIPGERCGIVTSHDAKIVTRGNRVIQKPRVLAPWAFAIPRRRFW